MTVIVEPTSGREVTHEGQAATHRWSATDWIVPNGTDLLASDAGLSGAPLNEASISTSTLTVTIDTFEVFIGGRWGGSDDNTASEHDHTLPGNATTTTLYLGFDHSATDTFIFGPAGDFAASDPKIPIGDFVDDGSTITATRDRRPVGMTPRHGLLVDSTYDDDGSTALSLDTGTLSDTYDEYVVVIYREDQASSTEDYQTLRINGSSSTNYQMDFYDSFNNTFSSLDDTSEWGRIAGVGESSSRYGGFAAQVLEISCPREIVANSRHYPTLSIDKTGVGKNLDYPMEGSFSSDTTAVNQINVLGSANSTGFIEMYGRALGHGAEAWF